MEKAILLSAAVISMIGGIVLYADDIPTAGAGIVDDGVATTLVEIALACFALVFSENGSLDDCSYN